MIYSMEEMVGSGVDKNRVSPSPLTPSSLPVTISSEIIGGDNSWTMFQDHYPVGEVVWGFLLLFAIFGVNGSVLWVVGKSRELWKPRHLWMACLCVTDLFVGGHKGLELLLLMWPQRELCVLQRATLGIPYVVNMLLLTLLSVDRFVAVRHPFYYSAKMGKKHVLIGFLLVLMTGSSLAGISVTLGMRDPVCRAQSLQLAYLTVVLTICSILTLFFNSSVLRIAKKQLNAIYAHEPPVGKRRVSLFCTNCGHKNATFVNSLGVGVPSTLDTSPSLTPPSLTEGGVAVPNSPRSLSIHHHHHLGTFIPTGPLPCNPVSVPIPLPLPYHLSDNSHNIPVKRHGSIVLSPLDLSLDLPFPQTTGRTHKLSGGDDGGCNLESTPLTLAEQHNAQMEEATGGVMTPLPPLTRTLSLPTLPDSLTIVVPPDPSTPAATIVLANSTADSLLDDSVNINRVSQITTPVTYPRTIKVALPRSRSFTCAKKSAPLSPPTRHHHLFRGLHFTRSNMFHVGRLFPSIRFARTVMLIMIPMWVFILPIVTIIPLHRGCVDGSAKELNCDVVTKLWAYLLIHMRSVLPLQAILDTLIYACGSKEFRNAFQKLVRWQTSNYFLNK